MTDDSAREVAGPAVGPVEDDVTGDGRDGGVVSGTDEAAATVARVCSTADVGAAAVPVASLQGAVRSVKSVWKAFVIRREADDPLASMYAVAEADLLVPVLRELVQEIAAVGNEIKLSLAAAEANLRPSERVDTARLRTDVHGVVGLLNHATVELRSATVRLRRSGVGRLARQLLKTDAEVPAETP